MNTEEILTEEGKIIHDLINIFINKNKKLERYKNIVDELEKHLKKRDNFLENRITLDKLKELKGE